MKCLLLGSCLLICVAMCMGEVGHPCTQQTQCAADECCQIINVVIMSKKRVLPIFRPLNTQGTCQSIIQDGESCNPMNLMNGYCGCAEGLTCQAVTTTPLSGESSLGKMAPAESTCRS